MPKTLNEAELLLGMHLRELGVFVKAEWPVCEERKWRFDLAEVRLPNGAKRPKLAFEVEGGAWTQGRHTRGEGYVADLDKYNRAALHGWALLRFTPQQVLDGSARDFVRKFLDKWEP